MLEHDREGAQQAASLLNRHGFLHQVADGQPRGVRQIFGQHRLQHAEIMNEVNILQQSDEIRHKDVEDVPQPHDADERALLIHYRQRADVPLYH